MLQNVNCFYPAPALALASFLPVQPNDARATERDQDAGEILLMVERQAPIKACLPRSALNSRSGFGEYIGIHGGEGLYVLVLQPT
jgi:hypothetical protein